MHFPLSFCKNAPHLLFPWCICSIVYME